MVANLQRIEKLLEILTTSQKRYLRPEDLKNELRIGDTTLKTWEAHGLRKIELPTESRTKFYYDRQDISNLWKRINIKKRQPA